MFGMNMQNTEFEKLLPQDDFMPACPTDKFVAGFLAQMDKDLPVQNARVANDNFGFWTRIGAVAAPVLQLLQRHREGPPGAVDPAQPLGGGEGQHGGGPGIHEIGLRPLYGLYRSSCGEPAGAGRPQAKAHPLQAAGWRGEPNLGA